MVSIAERINRIVATWDEDDDVHRKRELRRAEYEAERVRLRDQFAMAAVSAIIQNHGVQTPALAAKIAYEVADAMLKAREAANAVI